MQENKKRHKCALPLLAAVFTLASLLLFACANAAPPPQGLPSAHKTAAPSATAGLISPSPALTAASDASPVSAQPTAVLEQAVCIKQATIYNRPDTDSGKAGQLHTGDTVGVAAYQNKWVHISLEGMLGYVQQENLIAISSPSQTVPMGGWAKILVNPTHPMPAGFTVQLADFAGGQVDERIYAVCMNMFADAGKDGAVFSLVDAYRSHDRQSTLYEQKVQSYMAKGYSRSDAERKAATITARPDTSEHQTGLALDIVSTDYSVRDSGFANTRAFAWLKQNAQSYGFTLRYGQGKEGITKVIFEPWHWRFVGVQAAEAMKLSGQCLEEYLGQPSLP